MKIENLLRAATAKAVQELFGVETAPEKIAINETRKEFEGDLTVVVFPFTRFARKSPQQTGQLIGEYLAKDLDFIAAYDTIKGFLNLTLKDTYWISTLEDMLAQDDYGQQAPTGKTVVLEYIGPNTNKPLHVGHIRNMFIGYAMANILSKNGHDVHKVTIYNDRGIAISKSMAAWLLYGEGEMPESANIKGDHFVGKYYVKYNQVHDKELAALIESGMSKDEANKNTAIFKYAQELLLKWEAGDKDVISIWKMMNDWVYKGFKVTYASLGVDYEKPYYESEAYLKGKDMVLESLEEGIVYKEKDGSIKIDLEDKGLDTKVLLRSDGTSIYLTQDLAVAQMRHDDFKMDQSIYVVGDEQIYHFQALKAVLQKMNKAYADGIYHLWYGMVDLPSGKMKSREGKVVDADDLIQEMLETAEKHTIEQGKIEGLSEEDCQHLFQLLGLGALKYFILKVNAKKRMLFNPQESIDFLGHTGPYIQYCHARSKAVLRKYGQSPQSFEGVDTLHPATKRLIIQQYNYVQAIVEAGEEYDPSVIANYVYQLAKTFSKAYAEVPILNNEDERVTHLRAAVTHNTAKIIHSAMGLLGIDVPERM